MVTMTFLSSHIFFPTFIALCSITSAAAAASAAAAGGSAASDKAILLEAMPILNGPGPLSPCFEGWNVNNSLEDFYNNATVVLHPNGRVKKLGLSWCDFRGRLPESFAGLSELEYLSASVNPQLHGPLPPEWGSLANLNTLLIAECSLSGRLPASWQGMTQLTNFAVHSNPLLVGDLPPSWGKNWTRVSTLDLSNCSFSNGLPAAWSGMSELVNFAVNDNGHLSGYLPESWGRKLTKIQRFFIQNNKFSAGAVFPPDSWSGMKDMLSFTAQNNNIGNGTSFSLAVAQSWRGSARAIDVSGNCIDVPTEVLEALLVGDGMTRFDSTPRCLRKQPLLTGVQLSGPFSFSFANRFGADPSKCGTVLSYADGCHFINLLAQVVREKVTMELVCTRDAARKNNVWVPLDSSCIAILYRPLLECFVDAAATVPCDSKIEHLQLPPWHNVTQLATSTSSAWTFDGIFSSALHGAHYRYRIEAGLNFFPGFLINKNRDPLNVNFTNLTTRTVLFQPPPCPVSDTFAVNLSTTCSPCPDLARCNGTTSLALANETPAWRPAEHLLPLVACPDRFTRGCRVNHNETADFHSGATCKDNFTGPLCTRCSEGYGMNSDRACTKCPSPAASITLFCVSTAILIFFTTALVMLSVKPKKKKNIVEEGKTIFDDAAAAAASEGESSSRCSCSSCSSCISEERKAQIKSIGRRGVGVLRQLINHVSLIGALWYSTGAVDLKGTLRRTLGIVEGTNSFFFSSFASTSLSCLNSDWSPTAARFVSLLVVFGVVFLLVSLFFLIKTRSGRAAATVGLFLSFLAYSPLTSYVTKLLSACNPYDFYVASEYVQNRRDAPVKSYSLLSSDLAQDCDADATKSLRSGAVATLVLFSIGLPVAASAAYKLLASKQELRREVFLFLTEKYRPSAWYFEIAVINGRKLAMALIMGALSAESQSALQLQLYTAVCAVMLALSVGLKPLQRNASNVVDQLSLSSAILAAAFISAISASPDDDGLQIAAAVFMLLTQVIVTVAIFGVGFEWIAAPRRDEGGEKDAAAQETAEAANTSGLQQKFLPSEQLSTVDDTDSDRERPAPSDPSSSSAPLREAAKQQQLLVVATLEREVAREQQEHRRWKAECGRVQSESAIREGELLRRISELEKEVNASKVQEQE